MFNLNFTSFSHTTEEEDKWWATSEVTLPGTARAAGQSGVCSVLKRHVQLTNLASEAPQVCKHTRSPPCPLTAPASSTTLSCAFCPLTYSLPDSPRARLLPPGSAESSRSPRVDPALVSWPGTPHHVQPQADGPVPPAPCSSCPKATSEPTGQHDTDGSDDCCLRNVEGGVSEVRTWESQRATQAECFCNL